MKAVIALSGLAGLILFGPPVFLFRSHHDPRPVIIREVTREVTRDVARQHEVMQERVSFGDQSPCRFEAQRSVTVSAVSGDDLRVTSGSGSLEVVGVEGLDAVRAVARACASEEELLADLRLTSEESGSTIVLKTHYPDQGFGSWGNGYARLDLRVEVPAGMDADIEDGSGEMSVSNLGSLNIDDGSGSVFIAGASGDVWLDDGSGEIDIRDVRGSVRIDDGSGEIALTGVGGDVEIDDGSGEIEVRSVDGSVVISDSSGEIGVEDVTMDVRVLDDSSGDIRVETVGGDFVVERDGSGSIRYQNVDGRIDIPRKKR